MHVPIQPNMVIHKITLHTLAGQLLPWSQF